MTIIIGLLFSATTSTALAGPLEDIAQIKTKLESMTPPVKAKNIEASRLSGLYEIFVGGKLIYVDKNFSYAMVGGSLIEIASKKNLTDERLKQLSSIKFDQLPLQNAIEVKKGSGAYRFAVFTDPDCPYCKMLEGHLVESGLSDYTAYIFLYPLKELHPEAASKSESIWCAKDKVEAWSNLMLKGTLPEKANCENPLSSNSKLAEDLGVTGTPTIYLMDGQKAQDPQELMTAIKNH